MQKGKQVLMARGRMKTQKERERPVSSREEKREETEVSLPQMCVGVCVRACACVCVCVCVGSLGECTCKRGETDEKH